LSFGADLAGDTGDLVGERRELVDHRVHRVGEGGDLALRVDGDLLRQVAAGDGGGYLRDVADLRGSVGRRGGNRVGEVLPGAGDTGHLGLATELTFGADLTGDTGDLVGERRELIDHRVHRVGEGSDLALRLDGDLLAQVAAGDSGGYLRDVADLA